MEVFKLFGSIFIKNDEALKALNETEKSAKNTGSKLADTFTNIGKSSSSVGGKLTKYITAPATGAAAALGGIALKKGWDRLVGIDNARAKLSGLGHDASNVDAIMENALNSVRGTSFGMADAANAAANAVAAGIEPGKELERYLGLVGDAAAIAGEDLGVMGDIFGSVATTNKAYNGTLQQLASRGIPVYQYLADELGVTTEEIEKMASKGEISTETLLRAVENNIGGAAKEMGSKSISAAMDNMWAALGRLGAQFLGVGEDGKSFFDIIKDTIPKITQFFDDMSPRVEEWGIKFREILAEVVERVKDVVEWFQDLDDWQQKLVIGVGAFVLALGPLLTIFGKFATTIGTVINIFNTLRTVFTVVGAVIGGISAPVAIAVAAIAALIAIGVTVWKNWDEISEFLKETWEKIKEVATNVFSAIGDFFKEWWDKAKDLFKKSVEGIKDFFSDGWNKIKETTSKIFDGIRDAIDNAMSKIKEVIDKVWGTIEKAWSTVITAIEKVTGKNFDGIRDAVQSAMDKIQETIDKVWNFISDTFENVLDFLKSLIKGDFEGMKDAVKKQMELIEKTIGDLWDEIKKIFEKVLKAIVKFLKDTWDDITKKVKDVWNAIKKYFDETLNAIKKVFSDIWNAIKKFISDTINAIKKDIEDRWNAVKKFTSDTFNSIKGTLSDTWNSIKKSVTDTVNSIKTKVSEVWDDIKTNTKKVFDTVKKYIVDPVEEAKKTVKGAVDDIVGFFRDLKIPEIKIPKIKLPKFSLSGEFSLKPPRVPTISVDWFKTGGIATDTAIAGIGEAGSEAIVPLEGQYLKPWAAEMAKQIVAQGEGNSTAVATNSTIIIELDGKRVAEATVPHIPGLVRMKTGLK